jgi:hypothetical protein
VAFLGLVDTYVLGINENSVAVERAFDWRTQFLEFLENNSVKKVVKVLPAVIESIDDPFTAEAVLIKAVDGMLTSGHLTLAVDYRDASARDIVRLFLTLLSTRQATANTNCLLPILQSDGYCWWAVDRVRCEEAVDSVTQAFNGRLFHRYMDSDHLAIIADNDFLEEVTTFLLTGG